MPSLKNPRHERFAQELAQGKSQVEAYELAGFKPHRGNASKLAQEQNILERVAEIQSERAEIEIQATEKAMEALAIDKQWVMARLVDNATRAAANEDFGPSNKALELLGKEFGMFKDRLELSGGLAKAEDLSDDELAAVAAGRGKGAVAP